MSDFKWVMVGYDQYLVLQSRDWMASIDVLGQALFFVDVRGGEKIAIKYTSQQAGMRDLEEYFSEVVGT